MNQISTNNPFGLKIKEASIAKFDGTDKLNILPQMVELAIYQNIFSPMIKAEMLVSDAIGLFSNYPLTGEEILSLSYEQKDVLKREPSALELAQRDDDDKSLASIYNKEKQMHFIISGVKNIMPDDRARSTAYILELISVEAYENAKYNVSHSFKDKIEDMAEKIYNEYIVDNLKKRISQYKFRIPIKKFTKEESKLDRSIVVPNIKPFKAMTWLTKFAVAEKSKDRYTYVFFENMNGYNFVTIQYLIEEQKKKALDIKNRKYIYVSDFDLQQSIPSDDAAARLISNLVINNRYSTLEKIAGGYFENELFEINPLQKSYRATKTGLEGVEGNNDTKIHPFNMNTDAYISYTKSLTNDKEKSARIRYIINDYSDSEETGIKEKFGRGSRYLMALNQVDLHITIPGDIQHNVGDLIYVEIPEMHGFNANQVDPYISGFFLITELKHVISAGGTCATSLRINKDSYASPLETNMKYSVE